MADKNSSKDSKASDTRKPTGKPGTTPGPVGTDPQGRGSTGTGR